jgi:NAD(P)-dependent dehydrogenase (short-subunit alcohol dehydrogenase family)
MILNKLENKVIVVTGGTKGVGKGVVLEAAKQSAIVVIAGRDENAARNILKEIKSFDGNGCFIYTDLKSIEDCRHLFEKTFKAYDRLNGFFNYAGITTAESLLDCSLETFNSVFDVNIRAALFCSKHAIEYMIKSGGGSIVFTGSPHAWAGEKDRVAYACSKGAIVTLANHIAQHYAENAIRANYITMGWTPTEGEIALRKAKGMSEHDLRNWAATSIPAGRMTEVKDLVPGIIYLLSDESKMVSGSNFRITGGWYL